MILNVLVWSKPKFHSVFTKACEHRGFDSNSRKQVNQRWGQLSCFCHTSVLFVCLLLVTKLSYWTLNLKHSDPDKTRKVVKLNTREIKYYQQIYIWVSITTIKYIRSSKLYLLHYDCNYLCNFFYDLKSNTVV